MGQNIIFQSDGIPAIAGMTKKFAHPKMGDYMAGLWDHDLICRMCWIRKGLKKWQAPEFPE